MSLPVSARLADQTEVVGTSNGVNTFLGVPYAASISGENRWRPPQPFDTEHVDKIDATKFGDAHFYDDPLAPGSFITKVSSKLAAVSEVGQIDAQMGDACLNLNIWSPSVTPDTQLNPVMFWIHGGGGVMGTSSIRMFQGQNLAKKGVVFVSINYRLGLPAQFVAKKGTFGQENVGQENLGSNRGFRDVLAALRWTRQNIAGFGGDPDNITISGQSNGGAMCWMLLASPLAQGLFAKAIILSGPAATIAPRADYEKLADKFLSDQKIEHFDDLVALSNEDLAKLIQPLQNLCLSSNQGEFGFLSDIVRQPFQGTWDPDDDALPQDVLSALRGGRSSNVPILVGTCLEDGFMSHIVPLPACVSAKMFLGMFIGLTGSNEHSQKLMLQAYETIMPNYAGWVQRSQLLTDCLYRIPQLRIAQLERQADTFVYEFHYRTESFGVMHGVEIPFALDNLEVAAPLIGPPAQAQPVADKFAGSVVNFVRTGNPNQEGWVPYKADTRETYIFDGATEGTPKDLSAVCSDPAKSFREVFELVIQDQIPKEEELSSALAMYKQPDPIADYRSCCASCNIM